MRAVQINAYAEDGRGLEVADLAEPPAPREGEVLVQVAFAPVNYNDLLVIGGAFPFHPALPSVIGNEGAGTVLAIGPGVQSVGVGDRVILPLYSGTWRERMIIPARDLFALSAAADMQQAAMLCINPPTAALLISEYVDLKPGDWIVQNSANSGVGRWAIAFAKLRGFKTINLVRRAELVSEIEQAGGDVVLVDEGNVAEKIARSVEGGSARLALDGVSGIATSRLASLLSQGGTIVNYAQMSGDLKAPGDIRALMSKGLTLHSFYRARKIYDEKVPGILREAAALMATGKVPVPVSAIYPLSDIKGAFAHATRGGKVLLDIQAE